MKRGEIIDKGIAAAITLGFLTFVRPDGEPERWAVVLITILMYEAIRWSSWFIRKTKKQNRRRENERAMHYDAARWADEWITWPLREVSNDE